MPVKKVHVHMRINHTRSNLAVSQINDPGPFRDIHHIADLSNVVIFD